MLDLSGVSGGGTLGQSSAEQERPSPAADVAAELGIAELLSGGTTTVLDFGTTHHHDRVFEAAESMGIRMIY